MTEDWKQDPNGLLGHGFLRSGGGQSPGTGLKVVLRLPSRGFSRHGHCYRRCRFMPSLAFHHPSEPSGPSVRGYGRRCG